MIQKGEIVQCPACKTCLFEITQDIYIGDLVRVELFKPLLGIRPPINNEHAKCPECGTLWFNDKIHIKDKGWLP